MADPMIRISREYCEKCSDGEKFSGEEIARCIKKDWAVCPHQKEINEINSIAEIEAKIELLH